MRLSTSLQRLVKWRRIECDRSRASSACDPILRPYYIYGLYFPTQEIRERIFRTARTLTLPRGKTSRRIDYAKPERICLERTCWDIGIAIGWSTGRGTALWIVCEDQSRCFLKVLEALALRKTVAERGMDNLTNAYLSLYPWERPAKPRKSSGSFRLPFCTTLPCRVREMIETERMLDADVCGKVRSETV
jgi:hypothetical protein